LSDLIFCPTGGIDAQKAGNYLALPNVACVGGSWMVAPALLAACDFGKIEQLETIVRTLRSHGKREFGDLG
jgi:2-dehydro-3-deoxyphosphogluconate aldolase / (4S)-4-hydroxy-2-oxoglutarate aldolase